MFFESESAQFSPCEAGRWSSVVLRPKRVSKGRTLARTETQPTCSDLFWRQDGGRLPRLFNFRGILIDHDLIHNRDHASEPPDEVSAAWESFSDGTSPVSVMIPLLLVA